MEEIRLIIAGSRDFTNYELLKKETDKVIGSLRERYPKETLNVVSGTARGADLLGERYAKEHGYSVMRFPAKWGLYGKQAGNVRNREMLDYAKEQIGVLLSFWDGYSRGTRNMIEIAQDAKIEVHVIRYNG